MANLIVRLFLCITILSLNVQSQDLVNDAFAAVTNGVENLSNVIGVTSIGLEPSNKPITNEMGVQHYDERGFNLLNFLKPKAKSSPKVVPMSNFEKKYRERVALLRKLGDTVHGEFDDLVKFLLSFVGQNSRSVLSYRNITDIIKLIEGAIAILSIAITLIKAVSVASYKILSTFTKKPTIIIKFVLSQVLKALPLPGFTVNLINNAVALLH